MRTALLRGIALVVFISTVIVAADLDAPQTAGAAPQLRQGTVPRQVAQFVLRVQVREQGSWEIRSVGDCSDTTYSGSQIIESDSAPNGRTSESYTWTFAKKPRERGVFGFYKNGRRYDLKQEATVTIEATQQGTDKPCDEPVNDGGCDDCTGSPPIEQCGTRKGTLTIQPPFVEVISEPGFVIPSDYKLTPSDDPFFDESGRTWCPHRALSRWPNILAFEEHPKITIATRKALRYFSLSAQDQATCQRWAKMAEDRCKANFTVKLKELKTVNTPAPDYESSTYESVVTVTFKFNGICTTAQGRPVCFERQPGRWKRVAKLNGDPGY